MSDQGGECQEPPGGAAPCITVTVGATVPTGFEHTAAEEVKEKIGVDAKISKDRGRIYFSITTDSLSQVHRLKSVDNLFVVVEEYDHYQFKDSKDETLAELQQLASKLPWNDALEVWKLNRSFKKKRSHRRGGNKSKVKPEGEGQGMPEVENEQEELPELVSQDQSNVDQEEAPEVKVLKFRVTCSRAGDKHSFSSNEAARDFGGAVQEFFQWKADMTKFDIEVLLNIHNEEVVIGIALTEESLHRRNISHFGPTTLRSTLCYGMLRYLTKAKRSHVVLRENTALNELKAAVVSGKDGLADFFPGPAAAGHQSILCKPQPADIILDPMCGTGAIPLEGAIEFNSAFYIAGDNNDMAVNRTINNVFHFQKQRADKGSACGLPIDTVRWDLCNLPMKTSSVDIIITDMPFGKRMGSRKKNWDLYPSCLREMARVVRPCSGKAVLLTQDKKCFAKAISRMGGLWKKMHTVWVNVGGLHAGVYLLKRTGAVFGQTPEDVYVPQGDGSSHRDETDNSETS